MRQLGTVYLLMVNQAGLGVSASGDGEGDGSEYTVKGGEVYFVFNGLSTLPPPRTLA